MPSSGLKTLDLQGLGIKDVRGINHNLSYDEFFAHETDSALEGYARGVVSNLGAVAVDTGKFTGRSASDKYIVQDTVSEDTVWWAKQSGLSSDNRRLDLRAWTHLKDICTQRLSAKNLYVIDGFCGANPQTRIPVRLVTEVAWTAHFFKNMFIRPTENELKEFKPGWTILNACKASCSDFKEFNMRSEVFVAFNLTEKMTVIGGTWYGGEIKKGMFSIMNYFLPIKGIGSFHCSANQGSNGDTALFFGLSGTGKTTLSADRKRKLIGDDEHGWDDNGVFNFEGGCYAKCIDLSKEKEPDIFYAIKRNALLENVDIDASGKIDFSSKKKTENTRVSYPIDHMDNIVKPVSKGGHPSKIIFLTCDAYGVLPPVSRLTNEQAMYYYLAGYTAKVAGTEIGVVEPKATFSACFGKAFLLLHPAVYAQILGEKIKRHGAGAYLVNTGWAGGKCGVGKRITLDITRKIIDEILGGKIMRSGSEVMPVFNIEIPKKVEGVPGIMLNPRNAWTDKEAYDKTVQSLAEKFVGHFRHFTDTPLGASLIGAGPRPASKMLEPAKRAREKPWDEDNL